jgi:hypothetical protein
LELGLSPWTPALLTLTRSVVIAPAPVDWSISTVARTIPSTKTWASQVGGGFRIVCLDVAVVMIPPL